MRFKVSGQCLHCAMCISPLYFKTTRKKAPITHGRCTLISLACSWAAGRILKPNLEGEQVIKTADYAITTKRVKHPAYSHLN